jgi:t-SNARE complex subunit (syntaxin)
MCVATCATQVVDKVEDGVVQLTKAEEYQKSARPRWCIAFLLFFISILMVLLVLKHRPKDNGDDQNDDAYDDTHSGSANSNNSLTGGVARMLRGHIASELEHHRQF